MRSLLVILATALLPAALEAQSPSPEFGAGSYTIEQRNAADYNRYSGDRLDFIDGGVMVWSRDGAPITMMKWGVADGVLRIDDADLCPLAPTALYRVRWQEPGFVMETVSDDCAQRAASARSMVLVPMTDD